MRIDPARSLLVVATLFAVMPFALLFAGPAGAVSSNATHRELDQVFEANQYTKGKVVHFSQSVRINDDIADGGTVPATYTLQPTAGLYELNCLDADGCDITLSETGAEDGTVVRITNVSANACNFADTSGVSETASTMAMGAYDALTLVYVADRWVEFGRSDN